LNIGAAPNDGTGETLRSGGAKINTNYTFTVTTDTNQNIGGVKTFTGATTVVNGDLGVGTASPGVKFAVAGSSNLGNNATSTHLTRISGYGALDGANRFGSYGQLIFNANNGFTGDGRRFMLANAVRTFSIIRSVDSATDPSYGTGGTISSGTADFQITHTGTVLFPGGGNVGIGTTSPSERLTVNGNTLIDGTFQVQPKSTVSPQNYNVFTRLSKTNIAPAGTAVIDIDAVFASGTNFSSAVAEVTLIVGFTTSPTNLQGHFKYDFLTVTNGTGGGTATITMMHDGSAGSFSVGTANFAVTRPSARKIRITYTNANSAGNNNIFAFVRGYGIDTISIT
jgi:hypothetical protein